MALHPPGTMHPPGKELFDEAQFAARLDHLIGGLEPRKASPQLKARILAAAGAATGPGALLAALWPFGPLWRPATVLASAAVLGLALGLAVPASVAQLELVAAAEGGDECAGARVARPGGRRRSASPAALAGFPRGLLTMNEGG